VDQERPIGWPVQLQPLAEGEGHTPSSRAPVCGGKRDLTDVLGDTSLSPPVQAAHCHSAAAGLPLHWDTWHPNATGATMLTRRKKPPGETQRQEEVTTGTNLQRTKNYNAWQ
jgi:hypothetical protein